MAGWSEAATSNGLRKCRLRFVDFFVNIWFIYDWDRLNRPLAVVLNRFAAPRFVFIFGILDSP